MGGTFPSWTIETITDKAYEVAVQSDDYSLVALAALSHDPVVLAALRESVVLYAAVVRIGFDDSIKPVKYYHWAVDRDSRYDLMVKDFWDSDIWTTERYREAHEERL